MPVKTLTTDRLVLRPPCLEDAEALFERYAGDPGVTHFLTWPTHQSIEETIAFLRSKWSPESPKSRWVLCVDGDEAPSGMISAIHDGHTRTLGYALSKTLWGQGVMTEATRLVAEHLWRDPTVWRIDAHTHVDNVGSQRVLEKAGFRREGVLRRAFKIARCGDIPQDAVMYSQTRDDLNRTPAPEGDAGR
ncbi:ribosomal-protein-S5-alanine N-acetyltransferase [Planctomycetes bacterium MalM25]|nr:ribosomal-protein-S5-alanine N-acetyltransferase [Planctomycetes bacterium MalM25]